MRLTTNELELLRVLEAAKGQWLNLDQLQRALGGRSRQGLGETGASLVSKEWAERAADPARFRITQAGREALEFNLGNPGEEPRPPRPKLDGLMNLLALPVAILSFVWLLMVVSQHKRPRIGPVLVVHVREVEQRPNRHRDATERWLESGYIVTPMPDDPAGHLWDQPCPACTIPGTSSGS